MGNAKNHFYLVVTSVFCVQIVSLASDVSRLDTKSVALELRTAFRVDLVAPQQHALATKSIAMKAPAASNVYKVLAPAIKRYGFKIQDCVMLDVSKP